MTNQEIIVLENKTGKEGWDRFAEQCGGSYRCAYHSHLLSSAKAIYRTLRRFEVFAVEGDCRMKVGQCAVVIGFSERVFADRLQLLPQVDGLWPDIMAALLELLGPGHYIYGSEWSTERPRDLDVTRVRGVTLRAVHPAYLEVIDFTNWSSWDDYWKAVSLNARRNYQRFQKNPSAVTWTCASSAEILRYLFSMVSIRNSTLRRKTRNHTALVTGLKSIVRTICLLQRTNAILCAKEGKVVAFSKSVEFGLSTFYLEGGATSEGADVGWFVLFTAIRRAFERTGGKGSFVMGPVEERTIAEPGWQGLARSRRQCRVVQRPVATLFFDYAKTAVAALAP